MSGLLKMLEGKKTYFVAALILLVILMNQMGWIDDELRKSMTGDAGVLEAFALATLRSALKTLWGPTE